MKKKVLFMIFMRHEGEYKPIGRIMEDGVVGYSDPLAYSNPKFEPIRVALRKLAAKNPKKLTKDKLEKAIKKAYSYSTWYVTKI